MSYSAIELAALSHADLVDYAISLQKEVAVKSSTSSAKELTSEVRDHSFEASSTLVLVFSILYVFTAYCMSRDHPLRRPSIE